MSQLFEAVLDRPPEERGRFLAKACADDAALRLEVESLLSQADRESPLDRSAWVADELPAYNAPSPDPMLLAPGVRLGPYEIQSAIGAGGMGEVYRGRDTRLDRLVAIKILKPEIAADHAFRARFDREARTISQLDHPNICALYDVGDEGGVAFLVMPFLEGAPLSERIRRGALPLPEAVRIAVSLASALTYAHGQGVLHRDIKPQNVLMLADGGVKLVDFGVAKPYGLDSADTAAETSPALTRLGQTLGTLEYMSPEQLEGRVVDGRSDMFSLGIVLYQLVSGSHPFRGSTPAVTAAAILGGKYVALPEASGRAADLDRILRRMLASQPSDRYPTMADCLADLRHLEHGIGPTTTLVDRPAASRAGLTVALGAVLAVVAGVAIAIWPGRGTPPSAAPSAADGSPATALSAARPVTRVTYWLDVEARSGAGATRAFQSLGDEMYGRGGRFRVNVLAASPGHLYLLGDEQPGPANPTGLALVFAADRPVSDADAPLTSDWFVFTGPPARERLWLVWSAAPIADLATLVPRLTAGSLVTVPEAATAQRIRTMLNDRAEEAPAVALDRVAMRATLTGRNAVIVHRLELQHD